MDANTAQLLQRLIIGMPAFYMALVIHEYAHARMAYRFGDQTAAYSGRLTLNPLAHIDPFGTFVLPLIGMMLGGFVFGYAKPVPIDTRQFRDYRKGLFWVAFAGPLSNILFGFLCTLIAVGVFKYVPRDFSLFNGIHALLSELVMINFMLAVFNLLPVPPLDGSNMLLSFLNYNASRKFYEISAYTPYVLLVLLFSGGLNFMGIPVMALASVSESIARALFGLA